MAGIEHFGEVIQEGKYGYKLTRQWYALINKRSSLYTRREAVSEELWAATTWCYEDEDHRILTDEWCEANRRDALENFDLNMAYFAQIRPEDFEAALQEMLARAKRLRPVEDLKKLDDVEGLYVMVLDEYRQAYIGTSDNIRRRILKHWNGTKQFDRLIWGDKHESVLSIDAFRPLDTTRIYAMRTVNGFELEERLVRRFPPDYLLNRIGGGEMNGFRAAFISAEVKRRNLAPEAAPAVES